MERDQSTDTFKAYVKIVGFSLLILILTMIVLDSGGTRPLGYLFLGGIGFFAWRMVRVWDKSTVQLYALIQSVITAVAAGQLLNLYLPNLRHAATGCVIFFFGPPFERFLVRYTGFWRVPRKASLRPDAGGDVAETPWQDDPAHTAR